MKKIIFFTAIFALFIVISFAVNAQPNVNEFEAEVLRLTNIERINYGLHLLVWHDGVANAARAHSQDMSANNFLSHTGSDGSSLRDRFNTIYTGNTTWQSLGENVARGQRTPYQVVRSWMNSPGHRANILNKDFYYLGVGFSHTTNCQFQYYWTQKFARTFDTVIPRVRSAIINNDGIRATVEVLHGENKILIVSVFNEDVFLRKNYQSILRTGSGSIMNVDIPVDLNGATRLRVMLWNNLDIMNPFGRVYELYLT